MKATSIVRFYFVILMICLINRSTHCQEYVFDSLNYSGTFRTYRLYIPEIYSNSSAAPLLLNLHGYGSNSLEQMIYGDFRSISDTAGFILLCPDGSPDLLGNLSWNTFGLSNVDDIGFIRQLIEHISGLYTIDPDRIYSAGMSNGGFMSYELACELSDKVAAIASVTGVMNTQRISTCSPFKFVPVMQIHGTADATVPYNGNLAFTPVDTLMKFWYTFNACNPDPEVTEIENINTTDGCTAIRYLWQSTVTSATVELYKVEGGGHSWPDAVINLNVTNRDFNASSEIWRFFSQYRRSELSETSIKKQIEEISANIYPNPAGGKISITINQGVLKPFEFSLYEHSGRLVKTHTFEEKANELIVSDLESGLYIYLIKQDNKVLQTGKLALAR